MMAIRCDEYDKIEIACMFHYPVTLVLHDGTSVSGIAQDTKRNVLKQECIVVSVENMASTNKLVILTELDSMTIDIDNPHFHRVVFAQ